MNRLKRIWKPIYLSGLMLFGALGILFIDLMHFANPFLQLGGVRIILFMCFVIGVAMRIIVLEYKTSLAMEIHDRMFSEIYSIKTKDIPRDDNDPTV